MVNQKLKDLAITFGGRVDLDLWEELFEARLEGEKIIYGRGLESSFTAPKNPKEKRIQKLLQEIVASDLSETEKKLFAQKKRLADAERKLKIKVTKTLEKEIDVASRQIENCKSKIEKLKSKDTESHNRIFPLGTAPVIIRRDGEIVIVPMRYHLRQPGHPPEMDRKLAGNYNARLDNVKKFWKKQFMHNHGIILVSRFYENVKKHAYENRKLRKGEEEENIVLQFKPDHPEYLILPCLWDHWEMKGERAFDSFAIITDDPLPQVLEAGHDRTPIFLKRENVDIWLNPENHSEAEIMKVLADKERPTLEAALVEAS